MDRKILNKQKKLQIVISVILILVVLSLPGYKTVVSLSDKLSNRLTIVVDPGHGGQDSGAVSEDGTLEKDINLQIALKFKEEAEKRGIKIILTRESDVGLYSKENRGRKWSKLSDLKERKRIIEKSKADLAVSIHLNSFKQDTNVKGAQVFYPKNKDEQGYKKNKQLAEVIQKSLNSRVSVENQRLALPKDDIYLFENSEKDIVLVECGFLSNNDDKNNLKITKFQQKIVVYIILGIEKIYSNDKA